MPNLLVVQNDTEVRLTPIEGVFSVPAELAVSEADLARDGLAATPHFAEAVRTNLHRMVAAHARWGWVYHGDGFKLAGPFPHARWSTDARPDPGIQAPPRLGELSELGGVAYAALEQFERDEHDRAAQRPSSSSEEGAGLVDYTITVLFRHRAAPSFRSNLHPLGRIVEDPRAPSHPAALARVLRAARGQGARP